jgi:hypothetical protein
VLDRLIRPSCEPWERGKTLMLSWSKRHLRGFLRERPASA